MKKIVPYLILVVVSLLATKAFFLSGFIPTHDGEYHIVRQWQFSKAISDGQYLPVWAPDLNAGYGVPLFEFFYPLPAYIAHLFVFLGADFITSVKFMVGLGMIVSSVTFYLWARCFFKPFPAVAGSIAYLLAPYHTVDASIRGSVGEVWALAIAPLVLFSLTKLLETKKNRRYLAIFSISAMLLIISHNVVGILFYLFAALYGVLFCYFNSKSYKILIVGFICSLALSAFFWMPLIFESRLVSGLNINNYYEHFPTFLQLVLPSWGTGFSIAGTGDQMSFQIGLIHIAGAVLAAAYAIRKKDFFIISITAIFLASVLLMLKNSNFIWKMITPLQIMQFPWRLLSITILASSFLLSYISDKNKKIAWATLALSFVFYFLYTIPVVYLPREDDRYIKNPEWIRGTTTWGNTFTIKGFFLPENIPEDEFKLVNGTGKITSSRRTTHRSLGRIDADTDVIVEVKRAYFPGWRAYIDGKETSLTKNKNGIITLSIPEGIHSIIVRFEPTFVRSIGLWVSTIVFVGVVYFGIFSFHENRNKYKSS